MARWCARRRARSVAAMDDAEQVPNLQAEYWGGAGGRRWVELQDLLDGLYAPLARRFVEMVVDADVGGRLLDVGCGTGATTVAAGPPPRAPGAGRGPEAPEPVVG